jgi:hypothetical protein
MVVAELLKYVIINVTRNNTRNTQTND